MKNSIKRILIAAEPSEQTLPLSARHASRLAQGLGAEIVLLSCVSDSATAAGFGAADPAELAPQPRGEADLVEDRLEQLAEPLRDAGIAVTTTVSSRMPAYRGILETAADRQADLVVVGVHESRVAPHRRLTETDWDLMRLCPCPLLLIRDPDTEAYDAILAAVDPLQDHAEPPGLDHAVLGAAEQFRRAFDAGLRVANIYPNPEDYEIVSAVQVEPGVFYGAENIEEAHRRAVHALVRDCGIEKAEELLRAGEPAAAIGEIAAEHNIQLIVMGAIKRGRIESAVLGSTAETVIADATCDVLLVKPSAD
jgi:universal stress protein E